ncbi:MAG: hypothetical protein KAG66_09785 [Methylococcales bacterium]|nr:hypothetical protein [Methylococcales bacterium]
MNHLPPQAYTSETLRKAYAWLRTQPDEIKEVAKSAEILVGLFLKAQRHGDHSLNNPSMQNFKSDLKNIQNLMVEFDTTAPQTSNGETKADTTNHGSPAPRAASPSASSSSQATTSSPSGPTSNPATSTPRSTDAGLKDILDRKSFAMAHEVKIAFNLSSEDEAVRLLISLGFQQANKLFAK